MTTDSKLTAQIKERIQARGYQIRTPTEVRDLGIDTTMAKKRCVKTRRCRQAKARIRLCKVKKFVKVTRKAKALIKTG
eukprot:2295476-Karenia_brevis.AAC.1